MKLTQLFADEDAVSPVIGVILMVAITVILAAVIGTFVLGLGENVQDSAPQANFQFEYSGPWDGSAASSATITHTGGEDVDASNLGVLIAGAQVIDSGQQASSPPTAMTVPTASSDWTDGTDTFTVATGDEVVIEYSDSGTTDYAGETVRIVWTSPSGGTSQTVGQSTIPN